MKNMFMVDAYLEILKAESLGFMSENVVGHTSNSTNDEDCDEDCQS